MRKLMFFSSFLLLFGCTKEYTIDNHTERTVEGNTVETPPWVTNNQIRNFVYRLSLDLTGNQPDELWLEQKIQELKSADFSKTARRIVIQELLNDDRFWVHYFQLNADRFLEGVGKSGIRVEIQTNKVVRDQFEADGQQLQADYIAAEITRLQNLVSVDTAFVNGDIEYAEFVGRFLQNSIYDNINMGTENFVVSAFQHLFFRYPTVGELEVASTMVDGGAATLYAQSGNSKSDFLAIITGSPEFLSGSVRWMELLWLKKTVDEDFHWFLVNQFRETGQLDVLITELLSSTYYESL